MRIKVKNLKRALLEIRGEWHGLGQGPGAGVFHRHEPKKRKKRSAKAGASAQANKWEGMSRQERVDFLEHVYMALIAMDPSDWDSWGHEMSEEASTQSWKEVTADGGLPDMNIVKSELLRWEGAAD